MPVIPKVKVEVHVLV